MNAIGFIKQNITEDKVLTMLERHGASNIKKMGDTHRCACPIHKGNNQTSFSYNMENNLWICFTECGGGDIFTLVALLNDLDIEKEFKKVISKTAEELRIDINGLDIGSHEESYLNEVNKWLKYALKRVEIFNMPYDISRLGTRYVLNGYRGISKETLYEYGVGFLKDMKKYVFPIFNEENVVIGASLRAFGNEKPKWMHRPKSIKTGSILYNLNKCINKGYRKAFVVEGIIDCLRLIDFGIENVVCTFGARITDEQRNLFIMHFDEVILAFDNDNAGQKAIRESIEKLNKILTVKVLVLEEGLKDVGEVETKEEFLEMEVIHWIAYKSKEDK